MQKLINTALALLLLTLYTIPNANAQEKLTRKQRILMAEGIKTYDEPIHEQNKYWLKEQFGPGKVYPINLTKATKNIVWQVRENIRKKKQEPIEGIIRTFWYTHLKPVFARTDSLNPETQRQADVLNKVLVKLVRERNLMRYKDMGFTDQNEGNRELGKNLNVMIIGEKHGKYPSLRRIARELNCTVLTLGGQPSLLSMEYLVDEYKQRGFNLQRNIYALFIVDYDPAGWIIRESVLKDLRFYGMSNIKPIDIVRPSLYTRKELELVKYPLPTSKKVINEKWIKRTGGIRGQPYGFESDSIPFKKLKQLIVDAAKPHIKTTRLASGETQ